MTLICILINTIDKLNDVYYSRYKNIDGIMDLIERNFNDDDYKSAVSKLLCSVSPKNPIEINTQFINTVYLSEILREISLSPYVIKTYYIDIDLFHVIVFSEHNMYIPYVIFNYLVNDIKNMIIKCPKCGYESILIDEKRNFYNFGHVCNKKFLLIRHYNGF